MNKQGFMMTCGNCGRPNVYGSIKHTKECELQEQIAVLVAALDAIKKGRVAQLRWAREHTENFDKKLSDSALQYFVAEQALALVEGDQS